jgi:hypothetical protein
MPKFVLARVPHLAVDNSHAMCEFWLIRAGSRAGDGAVPTVSSGKVGADACNSSLSELKEGSLPPNIAHAARTSIFNTGCLIASAPHCFVRLWAVVSD